MPTKQRLIVTVISALIGISAIPTALGADIIVSANDGKYVRVNGQDTFPENPPKDTLAVIDITNSPAKVLYQTDVVFGIQGPPQAVAITPNRQLAFVGSPTRYNRQTKKVEFEHYLQVVHLLADGTTQTDKIPMPTYPQGIAVSPDGKLVLVGGGDGVLYAYRIANGSLTPAEKIKLTDGRLAGLSFTHDGTHALVALRDNQGIAVVNIDAKNQVTDSNIRLSSGVAPYTVDVSSDGHWAVVSNVGLAGLNGSGKTYVADRDSIALLDVSHYPFKTVQYLSTPSIPEGVAISPDGKWITVQAMNGSNIPSGHEGHHDKGTLSLYAIKDNIAHKVDEVPAGVAGQGVIFSQDSRYIVAQLNVEKELVIYKIAGEKLQKTKDVISLAAGPASIRTLPR